MSERMPDMMMHTITGGLLGLFGALCALALPITAWGAPPRGGLSAASEISLEFLAGTLYLHTGAEREVTAAVEIQNAGETGGTVTLTGPGRLQGPGMAQATPGPITFQVPLPQGERYRAAITITLPAASAAYTYAATIVTAAGEKSATKTVKVCTVTVSRNPITLPWQLNRDIFVGVSPALSVAECQSIWFELASNQYIDVSAMCVTDYIGEPPAGSTGFKQTEGELTGWGMRDGYPSGGGSWGGTQPNAPVTKFCIELFGKLPAVDQRFRMYWEGDVCPLDITVSVLSYIIVHDNIDNDRNAAGYAMDREVDSEQVAGEDDLVDSDLVLEGLPTDGTVTVSLTGSIRVFASPTKGQNSMVLPVQPGGVLETTWDLSVAQERTALETLMANGLYVEGMNARDTENASVTLTLKDAAGIAITSDSRNFLVVAAVCGTQPDGEFRQLLTAPAEHPHLVGCEWSVTNNTDMAQYNCIAWSLEETDFIYTSAYIDREYGDGEEPLTTAEIDNFYYEKSGNRLRPNANGPQDARVIYYSNFHAALRKQDCTCGLGLWIMFESKMGLLPRIEHVWDQLNDAKYGTPISFYKYENEQ